MERGRKRETVKKKGGRKGKKEKGKTAYILRYNKKCWGFYTNDCDKNHNKDVTKVL